MFVYFDLIRFNTLPLFCKCIYGSNNYRRVAYSHRSARYPSPYYCTSSNDTIIFNSCIRHDDCFLANKYIFTDLYWSNNRYVRYLLFPYCSKCIGNAIVVG